MHPNLELRCRPNVRHELDQSWCDAVFPLQVRAAIIGGHSNDGRRCSSPTKCAKVVVYDSLVMPEDPIVSELRAASASLVVATAAAQGGDWVTAEQGTLDAQERTARILRELGLKLASTSVPPVAPPVVK
jgi:hypothetical protein